MTKVCVGGYQCLRGTVILKLISLARSSHKVGSNLREASLLFLCAFYFVRSFLGVLPFFYHILLFLLVSFILTADPLQLREIFSLFQAFR